MLFGLFKRVPKPSPKRLIDLETSLDDVLVTIAWMKKSIIDLNARMATMARQAKKTEEPGGAAGEVGPETEKSAGGHVAFPHSRRGF